jgi:hypothetical protein
MHGWGEIDVVLQTAPKSSCLLYARHCVLLSWVPPVEVQEIYRPGGLATLIFSRSSLAMRVVDASEPPSESD